MDNHDPELRKMGEAFEEVSRQLAVAQALNAEWEQKAANWMASPEAQQQLAGYRELSMGKLAAIEKAEALERQLAAANERAGRLEAQMVELREAWADYAPDALDGRLISLHGVTAHRSWPKLTSILGGA